MDGMQVKEVAPFLRSLRRMLDTESPQILRWTADGNAFEIHDMPAMTSYVLPKYFKHCKYASFQRQLNYFHFRKWTKSRAVVCTFSNQFFKRDEPALTWCITRKRTLSPTKRVWTPHDDAVELNDPAGPTTALLELGKQLDPVQTTRQREADASLSWIDVLYAELDLDLVDDHSNTSPTRAHCFYSRQLVSRNLCS
ncbi:hypothetical protein PsorP6_010328 [Peronosclerospora sorghi]|uniref:Uncharacterized protein n=1 Tax=Peronosclerospora sorghi TaxID=230839 RepID=A0ACC0VWZ9_9STRA|nr:hypothetical protein PsorP6_010328 [Peronosclerospora sorghi]